MSGLNFFGSNQPLERSGCVELKNNVTKRDFHETVTNSLTVDSSQEYVKLDKSKYKVIKDSINKSENGLSGRQQLNKVISQNANITVQNLDDIFAKGRDSGSILLNRDAVKGIKRDLISEEFTRAAVPLKSGITTQDFENTVSNSLKGSLTKEKYKAIKDSVRTENGVTGREVINGVISDGSGIKKENIEQEFRRGENNGFISDLNDRDKTNIKKNLINKNQINSIERIELLDKLKNEPSNEIDVNTLSEDGKDALNALNELFNSNEIKNGKMYLKDYLSQENISPKIEKYFFSQNLSNEFTFLVTLKEALRTGNVNNLKKVSDEFIKENNKNDSSEINLSYELRKENLRIFSSDNIDLSLALCSMRDVAIFGSYKNLQSRI
ncbi:MAG: hypothetical protein U0457_17720 [Candidatus Sericytochromatia bacterium]